ncbi:MAG: hypothetical protein ACTHMJ_19785 [Thermomicrobiales bacterium]
MKAPVPLPFVKKGEEVPPSGVTTQAVLGFLVPIIMIVLAAIVFYFVIHAKVSQPAASFLLPLLG